VVLKSSVRELESGIAREREFNASSATLNAEYLVNVLRNFLMTKSESEHAKLVPVLCSLLHFNAEETAYISALWAEKSSGLVGWFLPSMPAPPPPAKAGEAEAQARGAAEYQKWKQRSDVYGSGVNWS
jgi:hypothetical protein